MAKTYQECDSDVYDLIDDVMSKYHPDLKQQQVTVHPLYVSNEDAGGMQSVALKTRGHAVAAQIKITSLEQRVRGIADAQLTIDTMAWCGLNANAKRALIDHELQHLEVKRDKDSVVQIDDHGRPKLKIRYHDYELSGFLSVVERHGEAALEAMMMREFAFEQLPLFPTGTVSQAA